MIKKNNKKIRSADHLAGREGRCGASFMIKNGGGCSPFHLLNQPPGPSGETISPLIVRFCLTLCNYKKVASSGSRRPEVDVVMNSRVRPDQMKVMSNTAAWTLNFNTCNSKCYKAEFLYSFRFPSLIDFCCFSYFIYLFFLQFLYMSC